MVCDKSGTGARVGGAEDSLEFGQLDIDLTEPVDDLAERDLIWAVVAVPGGGVHSRGLEQTGVVVAAQRAHAEMGQPGELADCKHADTLHPPPGGESRP